MRYESDQKNTTKASVNFLRQNESLIGGIRVPESHILVDVLGDARGLFQPTHFFLQIYLTVVLE